MLITHSPFIKQLSLIVFPERRLFFVNVCGCSGGRLSQSSRLGDPILSLRIKWIGVPFPAWDIL
jgi:hypothetical protein